MNSTAPRGLPRTRVVVWLLIAFGDHGAIQVDAMLHLIGTRDLHPIANSSALALNLLVGWVYRF
jgi:hypothetical protein